MKTFCLTLLASLLAVSVARGQTTEPAAALPPADPAFASHVDLSPLRTLAVQHNQTVKTFDSYARQTLDLITGHSTYNGEDPTYTVLDITYRPQDYVRLNLIKIRNQPLRKDFQQVASIPVEEQERIVRTGMVSLELVSRPEVQEMLRAAQAADVRKGAAVQQFAAAFQTMDALCTSFDGHDLFAPVAVVPPAAPSDTQWHRIIEVAGADPEWVGIGKKLGLQAPTTVLPGYVGTTVQPVVRDAIGIYTSWQMQDARSVSLAAQAFARDVIAVDPPAYPSSAQRTVEVVYNRLAKMTLPGAAFYFVAFVLFLMAASSGVPSLRLWGLRLLILGLLVHTAGIAVRWWLVGSIPIKNEFESVMFSAWFGVVVGTSLELGLVQSAFRGLVSLTGTKMMAWSPIRSVFGAAASFVGWLSLIAIFTVPYVFGTSIGQEIGQSAGVLMSYWLYIHVTMVTASYALIGMGFLLSVWWLVRYYADYGTLSRVSPRRLEGEARGFDVVYRGSDGGGGSAAASPSLAMSLLPLFFFPATVVAGVEKAKQLARPKVAEVDSGASFLAALDACNLVVLQLAFWVLGAGIVFGAIWADMSWGRPWGWDPKETFALVTWIVYLIVVHVRVTTEHKAWWTAVLSSVGFFVMLFNWIGVNFFLHGLHSYA